MIQQDFKITVWTDLKGRIPRLQNLLCWTGRCFLWIPWLPSTKALGGLW